MSQKPHAHSSLDRLQLPQHAIRKRDALQKASAILTRNMFKVLMPGFD